MADWKVIGGITALGGIVGFFGAKTVDSRKLPAGEKAVLTGASTGATMEGLEALMAAESPSPLTWPPETGCEHCKYYYKKGRDVCSACDFYFEAESFSADGSYQRCKMCGDKADALIDSPVYGMVCRECFEPDAESFSAESKWIGSHCRDCGEAKPFNEIEIMAGNARCKPGFGCRQFTKEEMEETERQLRKKYPDLEWDAESFSGEERHTRPNRICPECGNKGMEYVRLERSPLPLAQWHECPNCSYEFSVGAESFNAETVVDCSNFTDDMRHHDWNVVDVYSHNGGELHSFEMVCQKCGNKAVLKPEEGLIAFAHYKGANSYPTYPDFIKLSAESFAAGQKGYKQVTSRRE